MMLQEKFDERWSALVVPKLAEDEGQCRNDEAILLKRRMDMQQVCEMPALYISTILCKYNRWHSLLRAQTAYLFTMQFLDGECKLVHAMWGIGRQGSLPDVAEWCSQLSVQTLPFAHGGSISADCMDWQLETCQLMAQNAFSLYYVVLLSVDRGLCRIIECIVYILVQAVELKLGIACCRHGQRRTSRLTACTCCTTLKTCACASAMPRAWQQPHARRSLRRKRYCDCWVCWG